MASPVMTKEEAERDRPHDLGPERFLITASDRTDHCHVTAAGRTHPQHDDGQRRAPPNSPARVKCRRRVRVGSRPWT